MVRLTVDQLVDIFLVFMNNLCPISYWFLHTFVGKTSPIARFHNMTFVFVSLKSRECCSLIGAWTENNKYLLRFPISKWIVQQYLDLGKGGHILVNNFNWRSIYISKIVTSNINTTKEYIYMIVPCNKKYLRFWQILSLGFKLWDTCWLLNFLWCWLLSLFWWFLLRR